MHNSHTPTLLYVALLLLWFAPFFYQDPEVMAAIKEIQMNPANIAKYQNNPKIKKVLEKFSAKFGAGQ